MGGKGSGRKRHKLFDRVDDYRLIDIRFLKRDRALQQGVTTYIRWSHLGEVIASLNIYAESDHLIFTSRNKSQKKEYQVKLETTECHLGGRRHWFLCPIGGCNRRVAILYDGPVIACRHCLELRYPSQRDNIGVRAARRADRLREKLDWPGSVMEGSGWGKPKGMHWSTYERLNEKHAGFARKAIREFYTG